MRSEHFVVDQLVPESSAYKKARKQFLKSNRSRASDDSFGWSPFRAAEKKYKARFPPPDLSEDVLDLALLDEERKDEIDGGVWRGRANALDVREVEVNVDVDPGRTRRRAYRVPQVPGLVVLPGFLSPKTQRELVRWSLSEHARSPNKTNLDTHYDVPEEGIWNLHARLLTGARNAIHPLIYPNQIDPAAVTEPLGPRQLISNTPASPQNFLELLKQHKPPSAPSPNLEPATASELLPKLRWANIGWFYHWGTKQYDFTQGKVEVNEVVKSLCKDVAGSINWKYVFGATMSELEKDGWGATGPDWDCWESSYEPDAGIVNFYQYKDTLMGHVDRSEVCATSPLVSLSLGNAAVFLIGGLTRDEKPAAILLRSGDIVVMAGPGCRRAYHGVPRILEGTLPAHLQPSAEYSSDWAEYGQYLQTARINVNVRQVFPKGFDPSA